MNVVGASGVCENETTKRLKLWFIELEGGSTETDVMLMVLN